MVQEDVVTRSGSLGYQLAEESYANRARASGDPISLQHPTPAQLLAALDDQMGCEESTCAVAQKVPKKKRKSEP